MDDDPSIVVIEVESEPGPAMRVLEVAGGPVSLDDVTIRNGDAGDRTGGGIWINGPHEVNLYDTKILDNSGMRGGGIDNDGGTLFMRNLEVRGNSQGGLGGAGLASDGDLTIRESRITENHSASGRGGGIFVRGGGAMIHTTTVANNTTTGGSGGGIAVGSNGEILLTNVTVSGNSATSGGCCFAHGGGLANEGKATLNNVTIANNTAKSGGGGIAGTGSEGSTTSFSNTIVAGNTRTDPDLTDDRDCHDPNGAFASFGYNLGPEVECAFDQPTDVHGPAGLQPLGPYGSSVRLETHALRSNSAALDAGSPAPSGEPNACEEYDGRGAGRPADGPDADSSPRCDIGAFERLKIRHPRFVDLELTKHLIAKGQVALDHADEFLKCSRDLRVSIQRKAGGRWTEVAAARTGGSSYYGSYRRDLPDRQGRYRVVALGVERLFDGDLHVCLRDASPIALHRHS